MAIKKMSRAFQLDPMTEAVELHFYPEENKWYADNGYKKGEIFIIGKGYVKKTKKWKHETVEPLKELTAAGLKGVADKYGINGALAMVQGWGSGCLLNDRSYGLTLAIFEVANMATLGHSYDEFTDKVQEIGDEFIKGLTSRGFSLLHKGLWYNYKDENTFGSLVGFYGVYDKVQLHPMLHIEHKIGHVLGGRILPSFNPITFDSMLESLILHKCGLNHEKYVKTLDKYVSVYDRIKYLAGEKSAKGIESIFELQEKMKESS